MIWFLDYSSVTDENIIYVCLIFLIGSDPRKKYPEIDTKSRIIQNIYCDHFNPYPAHVENMMSS
jgi:hypothetical protein